MVLHVPGSPSRRDADLGGKRRLESESVIRPRTSRRRSERPASRDTSARRSLGASAEGRSVPGSAVRAGWKSIRIASNSSLPGSNSTACSKISPCPPWSRAQCASAAGAEEGGNGSSRSTLVCCHPASRSARREGAEANQRSSQPAPDTRSSRRAATSPATPMAAAAAIRRAPGQSRSGAIVFNRCESCSLPDGRRDSSRSTNDRQASRHCARRSELVYGICLPAGQTS